MTGSERPPRVPSPRGPRWSRVVGRFLARGVWNTHVVGAQHVPPAGPVIVTANHTGVIDGPIVLGVAPRPLHIFVKKEMFRGPVGWVLRAAGQIPVDRAGGRPALVTALTVLGRGGAVGIFPEGNRGRGAVTSARAGAAWLALNAPAPVVPVAVLGTRRTGEGTGHIPGLRRPLYIEFGEPFTITREAGASGKAALENATEHIRAALAAIVDQAVHNSGIPLPADTPSRRSG